MPNYDVRYLDNGTSRYHLNVKYDNLQDLLNFYSNNNFKILDISEVLYKTDNRPSNTIENSICTITTKSDNFTKLSIRGFKPNKNDLDLINFINTFFTNDNKKIEVNSLRLSNK